MRQSDQDSILRLVDQDTNKYGIRPTNILGLNMYVLYELEILLPVRVRFLSGGV